VALCIIWRGTGQVNVIRPILSRQGHSVVAVFDNKLLRSPFADVPLVGSWLSRAVRLGGNLNRRLYKHRFQPGFDIGTAPR
jgi:hypothetical protein